MKLKGKVALVTGSSQGIGQGIVLKLAEEGADVVINYRSHPEGAEETLAKVQAMGGNCYTALCPHSMGYTIQADLGSVEEVRQLIANSIKHFGRLDILDNVETALIDIRDIAITTNDAGESLKDPAFSTAMERADGLIIVVPEYNHGYPGLLKHVLDTCLKE